jgi:hypothetical protein
MSFRLVELGWDSEFASASSSLNHELRVVTPFLQLNAVQGLVTKKLRSLSLITRFNLDDLCAGVSSLDALAWLLKQGAAIRGIQNLHAKAYVFDDARAIVTSANLTTAALVRNHELGFVTTDAPLIAECRAYFDRLWIQGRPLDSALLSQMQSAIDQARRIGGGVPSRTNLGDLGAKIGLPPAPVLATTGFPLGKNAYVKFFGSSTKGDRAKRSKSTLQDVSDCGSHWACTYPGHRAPRRLEDDDTMFIARLVEDPDDILIYGRAIACQHDPARDVATPEDIVRHPWKQNWPNYIRVHDAEFLAGTIANGISLRKLADEMGESCFSSTEERAAKGETGINPLTTLGQKPDVKLSERGKQWVHERLEAAFGRFGRIPEADMAALQWPIRAAETSHQLSAAALKLLRMLLEMIKDRDFIVGRSQIGYEETLHALGIPVADGRAGEQLKRHGLTELAEWLRDSNLPAITGIIVNISGPRKNLPGGEYYEAFGRIDGDEDWRIAEIRKSVACDWAAWLPHAS